MGNNITVIYETKTDLYENMTVEFFNEAMKPTYEAMGMSVSNVTLHKKITNGQSAVELSYTASLPEQTMTRTSFITTVGDLTYTVTVTETTRDDALVANVFNTLYAVK